MAYPTFHNYDKAPVVPVGTRADIFCGWEEIAAALQKKLAATALLVVDFYQGVHEEQVLAELVRALGPARVLCSKDALKTPQQISALVQNDVTDDRIFGYLTRLTLVDFFDVEKIAAQKKQLAGPGLTLVFGIGAQLIAPQADCIVYLDMARWEIQARQRQHQIDNLGVHNKELEALRTYKHSFFVDWRVLDRYKKSSWHHWDFVLDTHRPLAKMISASSMFAGLALAAQGPLRVVPFFDPGVWGGQWMKQVCDLPPEAPNYAWCFDCVPEENSLYLGFGSEYLELPSINLVFAQTRNLLGDPVHARFGDEFPIRFDFLDTMGGQHLSCQVHPLTEYIQEKFGMHYTQDESYYLLAAEDDAVVYLGLTEQADLAQMERDLLASQSSGTFPAEKYAQCWPAKAHDHFLIPAGTVHCSGKNAMVLEISATPYIFTFKLWDWGRVGMDGKPRPINIEHGMRNIVAERRSTWVKKNLINTITQVAQGDGWREERTGLHERQFIETRRHWFSKKVLHHTGGLSGSVNVLNLIAGAEALVESPSAAFKPFVVHYAETFIIPAAVGEYSIRPYGKALGSECATLKAYVRI